MSAGLPNIVTLASAVDRTERAVRVDIVDIIYRRTARIACSLIFKKTTKALKMKKD